MAATAEPPGPQIQEPIPERSDVHKIARTWALEKVAHTGMMLEKINRQNRLAERITRFAATGDVNDLEAPPEEKDDGMGVAIGNEWHQHTYYGTGAPVAAPLTPPAATPSAPAAPITPDILVTPTTPAKPQPPPPIVLNPSTPTPPPSPVAPAAETSPLIGPLAMAGALLTGLALAAGSAWMMWPEAAPIDPAQIEHPVDGQIKVTIRNGKIEQ